MKGKLFNKWYWNNLIFLWKTQWSVSSILNNTENKQTNSGEVLKRWEYQTTLPASRETCMRVKKQQLNPGKEQWAGSKLAKEYIKAVYCHPAYLTSMQSTSCKMPSWMDHKLESRLLGEISTIWKWCHSNGR